MDAPVPSPAPQERYVHEHERLLLKARPSRLLLAWYWGAGCGQGIIIGMVADVLVTAVWFFAAGEFPPAWILALPPVTGAAVLCYLLTQTWKASGIRVTSERILLTSPGKWISKPLKTIKWPQFQEASTLRQHPLERLYLGLGISIRYGTPQGELTSCVPCLPLARDIKHYIDKVDSAVRTNTTAELRPFVAKPRGQRG